MSEIEEANGSGEGPIINSEMLPSEKVLEEEAEERRLEEEKKKNREPPIVFKEIDVSIDLGIGGQLLRFIPPLFGFIQLLSLV